MNTDYVILILGAIGLVLMFGLMLWKLGNDPQEDDRDEWNER